MYLYEERGNEIARLKRLLSQKEEEASRLERELNEQKAMFTDLKMARTISLYDKDIKDTKQRLTGLVREIDKCIALLNQ